MKIVKSLAGPLEELERTCLHLNMLLQNDTRIENKPKRKLKYNHEFYRRIQRQAGSLYRLLDANDTWCSCHKTEILHLQLEPRYGSGSKQTRQHPPRSTVNDTDVKLEVVIGYTLQQPPTKDQHATYNTRDYQALGFTHEEVNPQTDTVRTSEAQDFAVISAEIPSQLQKALQLESKHNHGVKSSESQGVYMNINKLPRQVYK